jgi:hypothetical protein
VSDPAEWAATRVVTQMDIDDRIYYHHLLDSAREALAPIRDVLDKLAEDTVPPCDIVTRYVLFEKAISDLSPLVYATEELELGP